MPFVGSSAIFGVMTQFPCTTVSRLRPALGSHFSQVDAVLRRLRDAGLLPYGSAGRGGVNSAPVTATEAALVLLALASGAEPIDASTVAADLASWRCVAYFLPRVGPAFRHEMPASDAITLAGWLAIEIAEAAADPGYRVAGLLIEHSRISTLDPGTLAEFERLHDVAAPPVLRDAATIREALEFGPEPRASMPLSDERGRPYAHALATILDPAVIRAVASAFRARTASTVLSAAYHDPAA